MKPSAQNSLIKIFACFRICCHSLVCSSVHMTMLLHVCATAYMCIFVCDGGCVSFCVCQYVSISVHLCVCVYHWWVCLCMCQYMSVCVCVPVCVDLSLSLCVCVCEGHNVKLCVSKKKCPRSHITQKVQTKPKSTESHIADALMLCTHWLHG